MAQAFYGLAFFVGAVTLFALIPGPPLVSVLLLSGLPSVAERHGASGRRGAGMARSEVHRADWFAHGLEDGYRVTAEAGFASRTFRRGGDRVAVPLPRRFAPT
jgi:hypothetical protein